MPITLVSKPIEVKKPKEKKIKEKSEPQQKRERKSHYSESERAILGNRLFESDYKKDEEIIIAFQKASDLLYISKDGRFGIKYFKETSKVTLYHYETLVSYDETLTAEAILAANAGTKVFDYDYVSYSERFPESMGDNAEEKIIEICRAEIAERKFKKAEEVQAHFLSLIEKEQKERELKEEEEENVQNNSESQSNDEQSEPDSNNELGDNINQTNNGSETSSELQEVHEENREIKEEIVLPETKIGAPRGIVFRKIIKQEKK